MGFAIPAPPPPSVAKLRPSELTRNAAGRVLVEVEGKHFARIERVILSGESGDVTAKIAKPPESEPNDDRVQVELGADVLPGTYRVFVETRSGRSVDSVSLRVDPDPRDRVDELEKLARRKLKIDAEPALVGRLEDHLKSRVELDLPTRASLKTAKVKASFARADLDELAIQLDLVLEGEGARVRAEELRKKCPSWVAELLESALLRVVGEIEPKSKTPTPEEVEAYARAARDAATVLRLGEALFFDGGRAKRLRKSIDAACAVFRERELTHVFSKLVEQLPERTDDDEAGTAAPQEKSNDGFS
jgi:hypothetical protein